MRRRACLLMPLGCASVWVVGCVTAPMAPQNVPAEADPIPQADVRAWRAAAPRSRAGDVVLTALTYLDTPYRAGGQSVDAGFDCSGFTRQVYAQSLGVALPRQADEQAQASGLQNVRRDDLRPGDLVFFNTLRRTYSHVGIYLGEGRFVHAPRPGAQVRVEQMTISYWARRFTGARRHAALIQNP